MKSNIIENLLELEKNIVQISDKELEKIFDSEELNNISKYYKKIENYIKKDKTNNQQYSIEIKILELLEREYNITLQDIENVYPSFSKKEIREVIQDLLKKGKIVVNSDLKLFLNC